MNPEFENKVTLSLNSYQNLVNENKKLTESIESIKETNSIVIGDWFDFGRTYTIINPNEAIIKVSKELNEIKKDRSIILDRESKLKERYNRAMNTWAIISCLILFYSLFITILLYSQSK